MKQVVALMAVVMVAVCSSRYDYYKGGVRYVQDGKDCIYSVSENARQYSVDVKSADLGKKIVYRNTSCADLYARDTMGQEVRNERRVLAPVSMMSETVIESQHVVKSMPVVKKSCSCCTKKKTTKQYVVVSDM